jgi:hypothetical protein
MAITSARVDPVTRGPVPAANGPSSARSSSSATRVRLGTAKLRLGGSAAAVLGEPPLVVHVRTETRAEHAAQPLPLVEARRRGEVGDHLLDVPVSAQGAMPPLLGAEAG